MESVVVVRYDRLASLGNAGMEKGAGQQ